MVVFLQQGRCLEGGERFAAAGGVPDVAIAVIFINALHDVLYRIDLVRTHDHEFLFARQQHHVTADGAAQITLFQEVPGKLVELGDFAVALIGKFVDGQKALVGIEGKVAGVVVGKVVAAIAVADNEQLQKAQQGVAVAIATVLLVLDDLLHGPARIDAQGFQFYLHTGHTVDKDQNVVAVVAVLGVDAQLAHHLEVVFAPVLDVHQRVVQRRTVVAGKGVDAAQGFGSGKHIRRDDVIQQACKLGVGQLDTVERLELVAEVLFQRGAVADVGAVFVLQVLQLANEAVFDVFFFDDEARCSGRQIVGGELECRHGGKTGVDRRAERCKCSRRQDSMERAIHSPPGQRPALLRRQPRQHVQAHGTAASGTPRPSTAANATPV